MIYFVLMLLVILIVAFIIYIGFVKGTIKSIIKQLRTYNFGRQVNITLSNKELIELAETINIGITYYQEQMIDIKKKEQSLKDSVLNISHDLRTPLTSIIGYLQLLNDGNLTAEQYRNLRAALTRSKELKLLISNFYELSIIETTKSEPVYVKIDILKEVPEYLLEFTDELEKKHMEPKIICSCTNAVIYADSYMLKRIMNNLISNAIKYGTDYLNVYISSGDNAVVIVENEITDNSVNIVNIFDKFYTADVGGNGGTGLGLYIAREFAHKIGGRITATKNANIFQVQLELKKEIFSLQR